MTDWIVPPGVVNGTDANGVNGGSIAGADCASGTPAVTGSAAAAPEKIRAVPPSAAAKSTANAARRKRLSMASSYVSFPAAPEAQQDMEAAGKTRSVPTPFLPLRRVY